MADFWETVLTLTKVTTDRVGTQLMKDFGKISATRKADGTLVTQADRWADGAIREAIAAQFPEHGLLSEETLHVFPKCDWCWVIDPIDGTTNFTRGIPIWGISIGLLYEGTPVFGAVRFPQLGQFFHGYYYGDSGLSGPTGAFLNDLPIRTSSDDPSLNHLFNLCARSTAMMARPFPCKLRLLGVASYNLLLVACGTALGGVEATPKVWDVAAAYAILNAAGGAWVGLTSESLFPLEVDRDYSDRPFPTLAVARPELVSAFRPLIGQ